MEAGRRGLRILFNLTNFWSDYGGMGQYVKWSRQARGLPGEGVAIDPSEFYEDPWCKEAYFNFVRMILTRVNSISGVPYPQDPVILGWAPANETQCRLDPGCSRGVISSWAHRAATEIKRLDPNHLVFMDCEGFWGRSFFPGSSDCDCGAGGNPYSDCVLKGCDFLKDCSSPCIDVACCHMYPDLWLPNADAETKLQFALAWIDAHVGACRRLNKPLVVSEFGKKVESSEEERNMMMTHRGMSSSSGGWQGSTGLGSGRVTQGSFFRAVLERCFDHMCNGAPLAGTMYWTAAARSYPDYDGFTVYLDKDVRMSHEINLKQGEGGQGGAGGAILEHATAVAALNRSKDEYHATNEDVFGAGSSLSGGPMAHHERLESSTNSKEKEKKSGLLPKLFTALKKF